MLVTCCVFCVCTDKNLQLDSLSSALPRFELFPVRLSVVEVERKSIENKAFGIEILVFDTIFPVLDWKNHSN